MVAFPRLLPLASDRWASRVVIYPSPMQTPELKYWCSEMTLRRYLRARKFDVGKAIEMLTKSIEWRRQYKPEDIKFDDVLKEAESGKMYCTWDLKGEEPACIAFAFCPAHRLPLSMPHPGRRQRGPGAAGDAATEPEHGQSRRADQVR